MEKKIRRSIRATVHTKGCNLKCDYCCFSQVGYKYDIGTKALRYPLEVVLKAFSVERLGVCDITIMGDGETLLPVDMEPLVKGLIKEGHYLTLITNGTLKDKIYRLVEWARNENVEEHLKFTFSLHFLELQRLGLLMQFANTVNFIKDNHIGIDINLTIGPSYIPILDEIKQYCEEQLDVELDVNIAREDHKDGSIEVLTGEYTKEAIYDKINSVFSGECEKENFNNKWNAFNCKPKGFCYAGMWLVTLDMTTGMCTQCLGNEANKFNFFEKLEEDLQLVPVGYRCKRPFCICEWKDTYNLMPEDEVPRRIARDLAKNNSILTEEEKKAANLQNIELENIRNNSAYISACFNEGDYEAGIELAEKMLSVDLDPCNYHVAVLVIKYGYALLEIGELQRALDLECCYEDLGYLADYCMLMGTIYLRNNLLNKAIMSLEQAANCYATYEEGTNSWLPNYNLGVIYECLGKIEEAKQHYEKCGNYKKARERYNELKFQ